MKILSVRQPWAWALIFGGKDIENRFWRTKYRGPVVIHASKGCTQTDYNYCFSYINDTSKEIVPTYADLVRGKIVGIVDLVDIVEESDSPWFQGSFIQGKKNYGWVVTNPRPIVPIEYKGTLGLREFNLLDRIVPTLV